MDLNPMLIGTKANRPESPVFDTEKKRREKSLYFGPDKIHRIALNSASSAICIHANTESPSCIWFKLKDHITEKLQHMKPYDVQPFDANKVLNVYDYVMAPLSEVTYARGRILQLIENKVKNKKGTLEIEVLSYVHFIDEGYGEWMTTDCLSKMEAPFFSHPWQAFPISIFHLLPGQILKNFNSYEQWPVEVINALQDILDEYDYFRIVPVKDSRRTVNYDEYSRADVWGLKLPVTNLNGDEEKDEGQNNEDDVFREKDRAETMYQKVVESRVKWDKLKGENIAQRLFEHIPIFNAAELMDGEQLFQRDLFDSKDQPLLKPVEIELNDISYKNIPAWRKRFPRNFGSLAGAEEQSLSRLRNHDCDPEGFETYNPGIPTIREAYFTSVNKEKKMFCVDWNSLKSPREFFGYILPMNENIVSMNGSMNGYINGDKPMIGRDKQNPIRALHKNLLEWQYELNEFYGVKVNRRPVDPYKLAQALLIRSVYGIYEVNDEHTSGSYRRVRVITIRNTNASDMAMMNEFCRVRFLDVGGIDIAGLLKIHTRHCEKPPMCIQMCLTNPKPELLMKLMRSDIPLCSVLKPKKNSYDDLDASMLIPYNDPSDTWPDVVEAEEVCIDRELNANDYDDFEFIS